MYIPFSWDHEACSCSCECVCMRHALCSSEHSHPDWFNKAWLSLLHLNSIKNPLWTLKQYSSDNVTVRRWITQRRHIWRSECTYRTHSPVIMIPHCCSGSRLSMALLALQSRWLVWWLCVCVHVSMADCSSSVIGENKSPPIISFPPLLISPQFLSLGLCLIDVSHW